MTRSLAPAPRARGRLSAAILCVAIATLLPAPSAGQDVPALTGPVTDLAQVIDAASRAELDRRIRALETASGDAIVVLTVPSYTPFDSIETFAVKVFEKTGVGARSKDNGALVVLAVKERKVRIEVGYGLEEFITDGFAGDTIRQAMLPSFRQGQYGAGLLAGTSRLIQRVADRRGVTLADVPRPAAPRGVPRISVSPTALFVGFIIFLVIINMIRRTRPPSSFPRRRWPRNTWSGWNSGVGGFGGRGFGGGWGGGGGGGFGGFGGGRSGGGGASGGW